MGKLKRILNKLLFPGAAVVLICVPAAAALLIYAFMYAGEDSPVAYIAYVFSAYALVILCANAFPIFRRGRQRAEERTGQPDVSREQRPVQVEAEGSEPAKDAQTQD